MHSKLMTKTAMCLAASTLAMAAGHAEAVPVAGLLTGSSATITHTGNIGASVDTRVIDVPLIPSIAVGGAVPLQYNSFPSNPISSGPASSNGRAGIASATSPTTFGLQFAPTTLLTQRGNTNTSPSTASVLRYDFDASWQIQGTAFGPGSMAGLQLSLVAIVPNSSAAFVEVTSGINFSYTTLVAGTTLLRSVIVPLPAIYLRTAPGSEIATRSNIAAALPGTLAVGAVVSVSGFLQFRVHNDGTEASVELLNGSVSPTDALAIPAPGAMALLAGAGLLATRRRR